MGLDGLSEKVLDVIARNNNLRQENDWLRAKIATLEQHLIAHGCDDPTSEEHA